MVISSLNLKNIQAEFGGIEISVSELKAYSPVVWLWKVKSSEMDQPFLEIGNVSVQYHAPESKNDDSDKPELVLSDLFQQVSELSEMLQQWLPWAVVKQLDIKSGETQFLVREVLLRNGELTLQSDDITLKSFEAPGFELKLMLPIPEQEMELNVALVEDKGYLNVKLVANAAEMESLKASFQGKLEENQWSGNAQWGQTGLIPTQAMIDVNAIDFDVREWVSTLHYPRVIGSLRASWENETYRLQGSFSSPSEDPAFPEYLNGVSLHIQAEGNLAEFRVQNAVLKTAIGTLETNSPISFDFGSKKLIGTAKGHLQLNLDALNTPDITGALQGSILLEPSSSDQRPHVKFELQGSSVAYRGILTEAISLEGTANLESVEVTSFSIEADEKSEINGRLTYDVASSRLTEIRLNSDVSPSLFEDYLGESLSIGRIRFEALGEGSLKPLNARYEGKIEIDSLKVNGVHPLQLRAQVLGDLHNVTIESLVVENPFASQLIASADLSWADGISGSIQQLEIGAKKVESPRWKLKEPTAFTYKAQGTSTPTTLLVVHPLKFEKPGSQVVLSLELAGGGKREGELELERFDLSEFAQPWVESLLPDIIVNAATLTFGHSGDQIVVSGVIDASLNVQERAIRASGALQWDGSGLDLRQFSITAGEKEWVSFDGKLPYQLSTTSETPSLEVTKDDRLEMVITSSHSEEWIPLLQPYLGIPLQSVEIDANLSGTLSAPQGHVHTEIVTLQSADEHTLPSATLRANLLLSGTHVELNAIRLEIADTVFALEGDMDLPQALFDRARLQSTEIPWEELSYRLKASETDLAPLAYFVPKTLRPAGNLRFDLSGRWNTGVKGNIHLSGISTRAIFPFGALRDMKGDLVFEGKRAELTKFEGRIGREPMTAEGWIQFDDFKNPDFDFRLKGKDIPVVRSAGVLLRTDMAIRAWKNGDELAQVEGSLNLKDGVVLMDLTGLLDSSAGGRGVKSRPPYFSVEAEPFRDWKLQLSVSGDEFLRLDTPVVDGLLSMDMSLQGTLGEPFMHGRVWFNEGNIRFPFASFGIDRGVVQLNREDPYTPVLDIHGESNRLDYLLQLDVSGNADNPEVHFNSSPALSSDQILLMIVAGEDPTGSMQYSKTQKASKIGTYLSKGLLGSANSDRSNLLNRLSMEWGNKLSKRGKETIALEFMLNEEFQLLGEYDEYDSWNAGIRWRVLNPRNHSVKQADQSDSTDREGRDSND